MSWCVEARSDTAEATRALAGRLATVCRPGDVVLLAGGLGAGKTTFAQGFARALGVEEPVTSPTFTLVRPYRCAGRGGVRQLLHADVYRLDRLAEVADLALPELVADEAVALVEWGDAAAPVLGDDTLTVELERVGPPAPGGGGDDRADGLLDEPRRIRAVGRGPVWEGRRSEVASALEGGAAGAGGRAPGEAG